MRLSRNNISMDEVNPEVRGGMTTKESDVFEI
jgi:hypothetical protein